MTCLPQTTPCRAPRVRLTEFTPAVLRLQNNGCTTGSLEIISSTGGLLCLSKPLNRGSRIKLMFLTDQGPVLGAAELLSPVSWTRQPFRFVALAYGDQRRLRAITQGPLKPETPKQTVDISRIVNAEQRWIEKYRAATSHRNPPRRRLLKLVLAALILATFGLSCVVYLFSIHLK
jgi:hypothetical protein